MMNKFLTIITIVSYVFLVPVAAAAQEETGISEESSQQSMQDSTDSSSEQSSANSEGSSAESSQTSSEESTAQSSAGSSASSAENPGTVATIVIIGAVVTVGLTVGGIILTVRASRVKEEEVIGLQDQIYSCGGKDFDTLVARFGVSERDLVLANDELVASGLEIQDDDSAAEYLAALTLKLAERSPWVQAQRAAM